VEDPGAVVGIGLSEVADDGSLAGTCAAVELADDDLFLQCVPEDGSGRAVEVELATRGGPVVPESLAAMVGLEDLQVVAQSSFGGTVSDLSLRTMDGDLLVLYAEYTSAHPGVLVGLDLPGWAHPFESLELVDYGCALVESDDGSRPFMRFALEVTADDGEPLPLFQQQQATVIAGGHPYEVSLLSAELYDEPCMDCATARVQFSIVRHP
jgi:hypothetical protein